jgi:outer membrane biosynthesis protein TonB
MNITIDTPTADVVKVRARIVGLAQLVFDHTGRDCIRAFSQFSKSKDLAKLIEAKREGVFDYSAAIQEVDDGYKWPSADNVLKCLAKAEEGELDEDDMKLLNLESEDLPLVLMEEKPKKAKKAAKKTASKKATTSKKTKPAEEKKTASKPAAKPKSTAKSKPDPADDDLEARLDALGQDLENAFTTMEENLTEAIQTGNENTLLGLRGLTGLMEAIYARQDVLAQMMKCYADQLNMGLAQEEAQDAYDDAGDPLELPAVNQDAVADIRAALSFSGGQPSDEEEVEEPEETEEEAEESEAETEEEEEQTSADDGDNGVDETVTYTKEALEEMSDDDLRELAGKIGISNASKIAYRGVLIRKIQKAQA